MPRPKTDNREKLLRIAERLVHREGYRGATLAKLAREARVPLGNLYYYFKTKEEIISAVLQKRAAELRSVREEWEAETDDPRELLLSYLAWMDETRESVAENGCPLGSLCSELNKHGGPVAKRAAALLSEPLAWIEKQFRGLGRGRESRALALHLFSALQGIAVLANTFDDPHLVELETERLGRWIHGL